MKLDYNQMYCFRYKPVTPKERLVVWDQTPLIFLLDVTPQTLLAINLHWIPKKHREEFLEKALEIIDKTKHVSKRRERTRLTYLLIKKPKYRIGLDAIRRYYISNISSMKIVPYRSWEKVLGFKKYKEHMKGTFLK